MGMGSARSDLIRECLELGAELVVLPASLVDAERIAWHVCKLWLEAQIIHINLGPIGQALEVASPQLLFVDTILLSIAAS